MKDAHVANDECKTILETMGAARNLIRDPPDRHVSEPVFAQYSSFSQKQDEPNNGNYANAFYRRQRRPRGYKTTTGFINARQALYS